MNVFLVELENRPGELARLAEALGARGVNITAISGATTGDRGRVAFTATDATGTAEVLRDGGYTFQETELVTTTMPDQPGSLGRAARQLTEAGVNVDAILVTARSGAGVEVGFVADDPSRAREALR